MYVFETKSPIQFIFTVPAEGLAFNSLQRPSLTPTVCPIRTRLVPGASEPNQAGQFDRQWWRKIRRLFVCFLVCLSGNGLKHISPQLTRGSWCEQESGRNAESYWWSDSGFRLKGADELLSKQWSLSSCTHTDTHPRQHMDTHTCYEKGK